MSEPLDAYRYIGYLSSRWRWIAASACLAAVLATAASLVMTPRFTATARLLIDPPAGADLRAAMAVSPIYLESLKTYERFADSDSLFQKAVERFALEGRPIESLKRRVLQVQVVRNTRIMEISVTLPDARKAHAVATFLAEATVEINRAAVSESDQDLLRGIEQQARELRTQLQQADAGWIKAMSAEPLLGLQSAIADSGVAIQGGGAGAKRGTGDCRPHRGRQDRRRSGRVAQAGEQFARASGGDAQADTRSGSAGRRT